MTTKLMVGAMLLASTVALAPVASAALGSDVEESFALLSTVRVTGSACGDVACGVGWADSGTTDNSCVVALFGLQGVVSGVYYDNLRVYPTALVAAGPVSTGSGFVVQQARPCPAFVNSVPPTGTYKLEVDNQDVLVNLGYVLTMSTTLCPQLSGGNCNVDPLATPAPSWTTATCAPASASFTNTNQFGLVGEFTHPWDPVMASAVSCSSKLFTSGNHLASAPALTNSGNTYSTDFNVVPVAVACDDAGGYDSVCMSCVGGVVQWATTSPAASGTYTLASHDWLYALNVGSTPADHVGLVSALVGNPNNLVTNVGDLASSGVSSAPPNLNLYDLNGNNSSPC